MSEKIIPWKKIETTDLENVMSLNFCFNVDTSRLQTSDVLIEISKGLKDLGHSAIHYGVGNFGFKLTNGFNPVATDGDYEGQWNDPSNDFDVVTVTSADHQTFKSATDSAVEKVRHEYGDEDSPKYFHWAKLSSPEWKGSSFGISEYCAVSYSRGIHDKNKKNTQMEIHWEQNKKGWHNKLLSKYAPWYSTKIGFPIVSMSNTQNNNLTVGIWQPLAKVVNDKGHEVKISVPENFGQNSRDCMQALRIIFGSIQASIATKEFAFLSSNTLETLKKGVLEASRNMTNEQRTKALKRLSTLVYRAEKLEKELPHFCYVEECNNPFEGVGKVRDIMSVNLDSINWGVNVAGKKVKDLLS